MEASQRKSSFAEYCYGLNQEEALAEAKRCLECGCIDANNCALRDLVENIRWNLGFRTYETTLHHRQIPPLYS